MHNLAAILFAATVSAQPISIRCDGAIPKAAQNLFSKSGVVLISKDWVYVFDPGSCKPRWSRSLSPESSNERPAVIVGDRVILSNGDFLEAYSIDAGHLLWRLHRGSVRNLSASPHLVAHVVAGLSSRLLRVDPASGDVIAERIARQSESMIEISGIILDLQFPNESDGAGYVVVAYKADDFVEMWRFRETGSASFVVYDGVPYLDSLSSLFPIDLKTGARGPKLPPTGRVDATWGGSTRELETTDDLGGRSRLRRNDVKSGKSLWTTEVPFDVLNTLRDGDTLFVTGGPGLENDPHHMATIDWRDGTVKKDTEPIPFIFQWEKVGDSIVATTWDDRLICFKP